MTNSSGSEMASQDGLATGISSSIVEGKDSTERAFSIEDDIENLAKNWTPPVAPTMRAQAPAPSAAPPQPPVDAGSVVLSERNDPRTFFLALVSPFLDETGSGRSVVSGLCILFVVGSFLGLASDKNTNLPSMWYRYVSAMVGYIYFLCWSVSFYPQVISNYKRKSTRGLSADFCSLNVVGFACYTAYNASLFWSPVIRRMYREKYGSEVTVESNDVAFAFHALILSSITLGQILYYGDGQYPSKHMVALVVLVITVCLLTPFVVLTSSALDWLQYLYMLSLIKVGISLIKYIPQVILNFQRRSTVGWSIWNILLDFTGGLLSVLQLVLDCADMGDFSGITGNLAKFCLGFVSIVFDILFMTQHYILYPSDDSLDSVERISADLVVGGGGSEHDPLLPVEG
eukprot:Nitzschia sp. Nitz4//scaffold331_size19140//7680//8882//NITZ4_008733-RA/size19140-processed-gene-0.33-mRNA-1//1//CDS//3329548179//5305//frame0